MGGRQKASPQRMVKKKQQRPKSRSQIGILKVKHVPAKHSTAKPRWRNLVPAVQMSSTTVKRVLLPARQHPVHPHNTPTRQAQKEALLVTPLIAVLHTRPP